MTPTPIRTLAGQVQASRQVHAILLLSLAVLLTMAPAANGAIVKQALGTASAGRQLLANPGFDRTDGWRPYGLGFQKVAAGRSGHSAIECINAAAADQRGAVQQVTLNQKVAAPLRAEAFSRGQDVSESDGGDYALYIDLIYQDGSPLWGQVAAFHPGTHNWERAEVTILPAKPVKTVMFYLLLRGRSGQAWFDDARLVELSPSAGVAFFDGAAVSTGFRTPPLGHPAVTSVRGGALRLDLDSASGRPVALILKQKSVPLGPAFGGFFARDQAAASDFVSLPGRVSQGPGGLDQTGGAASLGLRLDAGYRPVDDGIEIAGAVFDTAGRDRAITLYYALPLAPAGLRWWDTLRQSRVVTSGGTYADTARIGAGATGQMSKYPCACLQLPGFGLDLGIPMDSPRLARMVYDADAGQFYVAFDLGITRGGPAATFHFLLFGSDPAWGFRAAYDRYQKIYPDSFRRRVTHQGIWMPFSRISTVQKPEDFGFAFKEGDDETAWDDAHNVATFRYTEPMSWWMTIPAGVHRDYAVAMSYLKQYADGAIGTAETREYARATQRSADFDSDGKYHVSIVDAPWAHGALFIDNCNPRIPDDADHPNRAHVAWSQSIAHHLYDDTSHGVLDGEYLDSLEGWGDATNFRKDQFQWETEPLTFDSIDHRPCILQAIATYEFARYIAADVHRRGKLLFANSTPWRFPWYGGLLDVMGTETNWLDGGQYHPEDDETLLYRRMIAGSKPYLLLMNTDFNAFDHSMVEEYFARALFYGIFPSFFSHNAADNPYWENPAWYNRDRDLFLRYQPVIREFAEKGWEALTGARVSDPAAWVERFGRGRDTAFTVLNSSEHPVQSRLQISTDLFVNAVPASFIDRLTGTLYPVRNRTLEIQLAPQQVMALAPAAAGMSPGQ